MTQGGAVKEEGGTRVGKAPSVQCNWRLNALLHACLVAEAQERGLPSTPAMTGFILAERYRGREIELLGEERVAELGG